MRRILVGATTAVAVAALVSVFGTASPAHAAAQANARRVLIISLGDMTWHDIQTADMPHLKSLLAESAVADMTLHGANEDPSLDDGYVTIGTGARAEAVRRLRGCTQTSLSSPIRCPSVDEARRHNNKLLFDADVGRLGDTLARAGVERAVIAADNRAGYALAGADGIVSEGDVLPVRRGDGVAVRSEQPEGRIAAFERAWRDRAAVFYDPGVPFVRYRDEMPPSLLREIDEELGRVLASVDPQRDAVIVVSPGQLHGPLTTTAAALRAPGAKPGLARSAFTRRAGTVALVDVAPTVLDQLGIERPNEMEGRPIEYARTLGGFDQRVRWLVHTNDRAQFRDRAITQVGGTFVGLQFAVAAAAVLLFWRARRLSRVARVALELAALALLYFLPATHLAVLLPFEDWGLALYWCFLVAVSVGAALLTWFASNRAGITTLIVALSAVVGLIVIDVLTGAHLQFNAAFGYSPTIGGRYAGLGNLGYAQLAAGSVLLAGLLAHRIGGRAGVGWAAAVLGLAVIVDGSPFFGADVGGVLSMVPAFLLTIAMLAGWKLRWRLLAYCGAAALVAIALAAAIDLSRPADSRSHLGRLLGGGGGDFGTVVHRKLDANLAILGASPFAWLLPVAYLGAAYFVYLSPGPLRVVRDRIPEMNAALAGLAVVALLGTVLNDSGIAITGVMFGVLTPVLVFLSARVGVPNDVPMPVAPEVPAEVPA